MFPDGESAFGPGMASEVLWQSRADFRGGFREAEGHFRGPGEIFVPAAEGFQGAAGHFRGLWEIRQASADPLHVSEEPLELSAQR
jgi:hypothetical protein